MIGRLTRTALMILEDYHTSYRVQPADQRARAVPGEYLRSAIKCDQTWNGTPPGTVGTFEAYLRSLSPAIGLGFGGYGEWSKEVDSLIGQLAEIASAVPERLGCCHGPTQAHRASMTRTTAA